MQLLFKDGENDFGKIIEVVAPHEPEHICLGWFEKVDGEYALSPYEDVWFDVGDLTQIIAKLKELNG